jgi:REP element-mobilizing transposase RayT
VARRFRIQYPGALYHIINRGNYRRPVFYTDGAAQAFEKTLGEACERHRWRVHAYVVMRNHYHLAIETPEPNLSEGMQWLQGTFATRFNRFRAVHGHLFQGRYQSLIVEDATQLVRVIDYIHLNPLRAGLVGCDELAAFRWSSLARFTKGPRQRWLVARELLAQLGLKDEPADWAHYVALLKARVVDSAETIADNAADLTRGWAIGTLGWRRALARRFASRELAGGLDTKEIKAINQQRWSKVLLEALEAHGKTTRDIEREPRTAAWKLQIAQHLRTEAAAPHRWIAATLQLGSPGALRVALHRLR